MIAFDIDGCINYIKEDIVRVGKEFFASYDVNFHKDGYYLKEIWEGASESVYDRFWLKYGYEIYTNPPQKGVYETIQYLKKSNISACYITTRDVAKSFNGVSFNEITNLWLKKYHIELPVYYRKDKDAAAVELGVQLMVEDKPANILKLQKVTKILIYKHPYNLNMEGTYVACWDDILRYLQESFI